MSLSVKEIIARATKKPGSPPNIMPRETYWDDAVVDGFVRSFKALKKPLAPLKKDVVELGDKVVSSIAKAV